MLISRLLRSTAIYMHFKESVKSSISKLTNTRNCKKSKQHHSIARVAHSKKIQTRYLTSLCLNINQLSMCYFVDLSMWIK